MRHTKPPTLSRSPGAKNQQAALADSPDTLRVLEEFGQSLLQAALDVQGEEAFGVYLYFSIAAIKL